VWTIAGGVASRASTVKVFGVPGAVAGLREVFAGIAVSFASI